jgi:hypothetical protein
MGVVISLDRHRRRRHGGMPAADGVARLERAVARLEPAVRRTPGGLTATLERELRTIVVAVNAGRHGEAADRAERLLGLLAHPALSG